MKKILFMTSVLLFTCAQAESIRADVKGVTVSGVSGAYTFAVKLKSIETGCEQYADWWEVLSEDGELLYRRILVHSHPDTQPFTRSGGQVAIKASDVVYVRAHMNKVGYVGAVFKGSVKEGFKVVTKVLDFSKKVEIQKPLPKGCLY
jgi:hypothetical protein